MERVEKPVILVVEDDPSVRSMMVAALLPLGEVIEAGDGEAATSIIHERVPHVVCLDLTLPETSGFGVCKAVRAMPLSAYIRVLVVSGRATLSDRVHALEVGADDFLPKPFRARELTDRVSQWVRDALRSRTSMVPRVHAPVRAAASTTLKTTSKAKSEASVTSVASIAYSGDSLAPGGIHTANSKVVEGISEVIS